jgi:putative transposase
MREMDLQALYPKKNLSRPGVAHKIYPYLLKDLPIVRINQVWATDITYIKLPQGVVYLVAIIDLYSRCVIAWELSNCIDRAFCITMLEKALKRGIPEIVNTDQGAQFTSQEWTSRLEQEGIQISMDGVGRCMDNIYIERFWRTLKYEDMYLMAYEDMRDAYKKISAYINFYNSERPHSSLGYQTPAEVYERSRSVITDCKKIFREESKSKHLASPSF